MKDFAIGLMMSTGAKLNRSYGIVSVPLRWSTLPKATARPVLLLNQDESNAIDLDLGTGAGATTAADVSPPILPVAQKEGLNVKKKVKSTVVKRAAPTVTSTPVTQTSTKQSTTVIPEKADNPGGFKIPLKRCRLPSEVESSDSSDGRVSAVSTKPESWDCATRKHGGVFSGYQDQPKFRRRGVPSQKRRIKKVPGRTEVHNSDLVAERYPSGDSKSVESLEAPRDFESMARMIQEIQRQLMEQRERPQRHLGRRTHETERRSDRFEQHSRVRNWRCPDRPRYPEEQSRGRRDRGVADNRWR